MSIRNLFIWITLGSFLSLPGCGQEQPDDSTKTSPSTSSVSVTTTQGCQTCHPFELTGEHASISCTDCHDGNNQTSDADLAHVGLTAHPAHPENMQAKCGNCHTQTTSALMTSHFTLVNKVNLVRHHFGAKKELKSLVDVPATEEPSSPLELADDLLRRRCLRCHVYYEGDEYDKVRRGTGCGACHLQYENGRMLSHDFLAAPTDQQCLSCHYGNRVGSDYYGRFDHDFKHEYRTPYEADGSYPSRPYAVEQRRLKPDVHQRAGMICRDCHFDMHSGQNMASIKCKECHLATEGQPLPGKQLNFQSGVLTLQSLGNAGKIRVPAAKHPVHTHKNIKAACVVCHAVWTFNEQETHLLRIDNTDYEEWDDLFVQDSSEVEVLLLNGIYGDEELDPVMTDKVTGKLLKGLWLKGFKTRRWESPIIEADDQGRLQIKRPILDLHISWLDDEGETEFDSIIGLNKGLRPYTPHTIGKAGAFYQQRLKRETTNQDTLKTP